MTTELLIVGGDRVPAAEEGTFTVIEPGNGSPMAEVAEAGPEDARRAVDVAVRAFEEGPWPRTSATERGRVLLRASVLVRERLEELAEIEARNVGKPIGDARDEVGIVANTFEYYGGAANKLFGETVPVQDPGLDVVLREPVGVCALITPWNFPLLIATWKLSPALACGNAVVVKPASLTPLSLLRLAEILVEAGLPEGTMSVLPGPGSSVGNALVTDPRVSKVGFTGSTDDRGGDPGARGPEHHAGLARARRQVRVRGVRRRRHGHAASSTRCGGVRQHRSGLLRPQPDLRGASPRTTSSSRRSPRPRRSRWAAALARRPRWGRWSRPRQRQTSLDYLEIGQKRARAWSPAARSPRFDGANGFYLTPGGAGRRRQRDGASPRRRSSAGGVRDPVRRRGRRDPHRQRQPTTASPARCGRATSAGRSVSPRRSAPACSP